MHSNETLQAPYEKLVTIKGDLTLLENLLGNIYTMEDEARGELEHFVHRINERLFTVLDELDPVPQA